MRVSIAWISFLAACGVATAGSQCIGIESDLDRLACYDKESGRTPVTTEAAGAGVWRGAKDFGELKGRVDSLPTTAKVATLLGIAVAIITIVSKWAEIKAIFG